MTVRTTKDFTIAAGFAIPCNLCGNDTQFTAMSEQVAAEVSGAMRAGQGCRVQETAFPSKAEEFVRMKEQLVNGVRVAGLCTSTIIMLSLFQANLSSDLPFALQLTLASAMGFWAGACWSSSE